MSISDNTYRPRIAAEVRQDQLDQLQKILPRGMQKILFQALIDGVIELYNRGGFEALGPIISRHISITQLAEVGEDYTKKTLLHK